MRGPAVGDRFAVSFDEVLVTEPRAPDVEAAHMDPQRVREASRREVAHLRLEDERLDPLFPQRLVAAGEAGQVLDSGDLEPDEVDRVVGDSLRVGLGEPDTDLGRERVCVAHAVTLRPDTSGARALAALLRDRQPCVVLTGAGVSTESGIPDFRSPQGLWARFDPLEYGSISAFRADPAKVWAFYVPRFAALTEAEPNAAHHALARLEQAGLVRAVITQNIDLLHERAGSREVIEVHGSIRTSTCPRCGAGYPLQRVLELLEAEEAPACPDCGAILKPDVVFFGELLPEEAIDRAFALARQAALLLVVGSALEVHPVAGLPLETLAAGGDVAIVNRGPTALDGRATLKVEGSAGEALAAVVSELVGS